MKTITVATDCIRALENWEYSVKENEHDYKILGIGQNRENHTGRCFCQTPADGVGLQHVEFGGRRSRYDRGFVADRLGVGWLG